MALTLELIGTLHNWFLSNQLSYMLFLVVFFFFSNLMPFSSCSVLGGVNPSFKKELCDIKLSNMNTIY